MYDSTCSRIISFAVLKITSIYVLSQFLSITLWFWNFFITVHVFKRFEILIMDSTHKEPSRKKNLGSWFLIIWITFNISASFLKLPLNTKSVGYVSSCPSSSVDVSSLSSTPNSLARASSCRCFLFSKLFFNYYYLHLPFFVLFIHMQFVKVVRFKTLIITKDFFLLLRTLVFHLLIESNENLRKKKTD